MGSFLLGSVHPLGSWAEDEALPGSLPGPVAASQGLGFLNLSSEEVGQSDPRGPWCAGLGDHHTGFGAPPCSPLAKPESLSQGTFPGQSRRSPHLACRPPWWRKTRQCGDDLGDAGGHQSAPSASLGRLAGARTPSAYLSVHEGGGGVPSVNTEGQAPSQELSLCRLTKNQAKSLQHV